MSSIWPARRGKDKHPFLLRTTSQRPPELCSSISGYPLHGAPKGQEAEKRGLYCREPSAWRLSESINTRGKEEISRKNLLTHSQAMLATIS